MMQMLDEVRSTYDLSILMTTHDFAMLPRYADQVALVDHTIIKQGSAADVLDSPEFQKIFHLKGGSAE